jgi:hypothetical protein
MPDKVFQRPNNILRSFHHLILNYPRIRSQITSKIRDVNILIVRFVFLIGDSKAKYFVF